MIFLSHIYRQSHMDFFCAQQDQVYGNIRVPASQATISDLQCMYWMGGEL